MDGCQTAKSRGTPERHWQDSDTDKTEPRDGEASDEKASDEEISDEKGIDDLTESDDEKASDEKRHMPSTKDRDLDEERRIITEVMLELLKGYTKTQQYVYYVKSNLIL